MPHSPFDGTRFMRVIRCAGRDALAPEEAAAVGATTRAAGVILFPTDTLYGLGVDPCSPAGLAALFRLKGRDPGKPFPVLLADASLVGRYAAAIPAPWRVLMKRFWPGPLTLLFPALPGLAQGIGSASGKVALRVPGSALCRSVLRAAGGSLTGTSANAAGAGGTGDPAIALRDVRNGIKAQKGTDLFLSAKINLSPFMSPVVFVNAGTLPPSPASTILDMDPSGMVMTLRAGAVPETDLRRALHEESEG